MPGWRRNSQLEDEEREASLQTLSLLVDKWFVDKGFGFGKVPTGEVVFIHASVVRGAEVLTIGTEAWVQVVHDDARAQGRCRACKAWGHAAETRRGKQSGRASEASSGADGRAGSSVGEGSLRGVQPSPRFSRRAGQSRQFHVADKKEEAWELFPETTETGSDAVRGVRAGSTSRKRKSTHLSVLPVQMKSLCKAWLQDLLKIALAQDRKKEARERQTMEQEDSNSQRRRAWEKIRDPRVLALSPFLALSRDVRLDVELAALVSSVETNNFMLDFALVAAPTSTHRVHHGETR